MDISHILSPIQSNQIASSRNFADSTEIINLYGESINALQQSAAALQAAYAKYLESGISQAQNDSPSTPMTLTVEEMAKELNISKNTAYALAKEPGFPAFPVGRHIRINRRGLQQWMDNGGTKNVKAC